MSTKFFKIDIKLFAVQMRRIFMLCPYCNNLMEEGEIPQDRYPLKWKPKDSKFLDLDKKSIKLSSVLEDKRCVAYLCKECKKIIVNL